jgi:hypothetical protein
MPLCREVENKLWSLGGIYCESGTLSTRNKDRIDKGVINSKYPIYSYAPGTKEIDGITSATSQYFANKGLLILIGMVSE